MRAWQRHVEAGHRIIELWPIQHGGCSCGQSTCKPSSRGKHPRYAHWPTTPVIDEDRDLDEIPDSVYGHGYGVLVDGLLVVDVDVRNGGADSLRKLEDDLGWVMGMAAGYAVETGSADGSMHYYFSLPASPVSLRQTLGDYPGIDFKTSGFVVGAESEHASGSRYHVSYGDPYSIGDAPPDLLAMLTRPATVRAQVGDRVCDVELRDIADAVSVMPARCDYDRWIRVGMAIHHATGGSGEGLDMWDRWSATSPEQYPGRHQLSYKWASFGKSANPVTVGTLFAWAKEAGWAMPSRLQPAEIALVELPEGSPPIDIRGVDLLRPPGFVGEIASWIDSQCLFPRPRLVAAAALLTVGNAAGLAWEDDISGATANLMIFCIAGSASGKEAVGQAVAQLHVSAGLSPAVHGAIKSTQEITRNLIAHQSAYYMVDELGILLGQIVNAQKRGGAAYLEGVIGDLMKIYSKADGVYLVSGDVKRDARAEVERDLKALRKRLDEAPNSALEARVARTEAALETLDVGIMQPFLSMIGYSTESTFAGVMSYDQATSGFLGRALLVRETDDNPLPRQGPRAPREVPARIASALEMLAHGRVGDKPPRIEMERPRQRITTADDARAALEAVRLWTYTDLSAHHQEHTGLTPIARRCYEQIAKVSLVLAAPSGVRTLEHVRWATALAVRDVREKVREVIASEKDGAHALHAAVLSILGDEPATLSAVRNARTLRKESRAAVEAALQELVNLGRVIEGERPDGRSKTKVVRTYCRADG